MRLLVIDDHFAVRLGVRGALSSLTNVEVIEARDVAEAILLVESVQPDACIIDIRLGGADGLELLAALRRLRPGLQFIVFSAFLEGPARRRSVALGAVDCVDKCSDIEALRQAVRRALPRCAYKRDRLAADGDRLRAERNTSRPDCHSCTSRVPIVALTAVFECLSSKPRVGRTQPVECRRGRIHRSGTQLMGRRREE